eukprot:TRINITY_DN387_c0_g1_i1.p1 TRINITY_DN387_c0_g1~~TRINITY_DN387_c0_g1_i1.p1  ORF type:complete len:1647 (-),score=644.33 TRINITY_DN387_c0_g1_i1:1802-6742(-)
MGVTLKHIGLGEVLFGQALLSKCTIELTQFNMLEVALSKVLPKASMSGEECNKAFPNPKCLGFDSSKIEQTYSVDDLWIFWIYQSVVPIPIPAFHNHLSFKYRNILGAEMATGTELPFPNGNPAALFKVAPKLLTFFKDKKALMPEKLEGDMNLKFTVQKSFVKFPQILGSYRIGNKDADKHLFSIDAYSTVAKAANAIKKMSLGGIAATIPLKLRSGVISIRLFDFEMAKGSFALVNVREWEKIVSGKEQTSGASDFLRELNALPKEQRDDLVGIVPDSAGASKASLDWSFVTIILGNMDIPGIMKLRSQLAVSAMASKGIEGGMGLRLEGSFMKAFKFMTKGFAKVRLVKDKPIAFNLHGAMKVTLFGNDVVTGSAYLDSSKGLGFDGKLSMFNVHQHGFAFVGSLKGKINKKEFLLAGAASVKIRGMQLMSALIMDAKFKLTHKSLDFTGTFFTQKLRFAVDIAKVELEAEMSPFGIKKIFHFAGNSKLGGPRVKIGKSGVELSIHAQVLMIEGKLDMKISNHGSFFELDGNIMGNDMLKAHLFVESKKEIYNPKGARLIASARFGASKILKVFKTLYSAAQAAGKIAAKAIKAALAVAEGVYEAFKLGLNTAYKAAKAAVSTAKWAFGAFKSLLRWAGIPFSTKASRAKFRKVIQKYLSKRSPKRSPKRSRRRSRKRSRKRSRRRGRVQGGYGSSTQSSFEPESVDEESQDDDDDGEENDDDDEEVMDADAEILTTGPESTANESVTDVSELFTDYAGEEGQAKAKTVLSRLGSIDEEQLLGKELFASKNQYHDEYAQSIRDSEAECSLFHYHNPEAEECPENVHEYGYGMSPEAKEEHIAQMGQAHWIKRVTEEIGDRYQKIEQLQRQKVELWLSDPAERLAAFKHLAESADKDATISDADRQLAHKLLRGELHRQQQMEHEARGNTGDEEQETDDFVADDADVFANDENDEPEDMDGTLSDSDDDEELEEVDQKASDRVKDMFLGRAIRAVGKAVKNLSPKEAYRRLKRKVSKGIKRGWRKFSGRVGRLVRGAVKVLNKVGGKLWKKIKNFVNNRVRDLEKILEKADKKVDEFKRKIDAKLKELGIKKMIQEIKEWTEFLENFPTLDIRKLEFDASANKIHDASIQFRFAIDMKGKWRGKPKTWQYQQQFKIRLNKLAADLKTMFEKGFNDLKMFFFGNSKVVRARKKDMKTCRVDLDCESFVCGKRKGMSKSCAPRFGFPAGSYCDPSGSHCARGTKCTADPKNRRRAVCTFRDYDTCTKDNECESGVCSKELKMCKPKNGFAAGERCGISSECQQDMHCFSLEKGMPKTCASDSKRYVNELMHGDKISLRVSGSKKKLVVHDSKGKPLGVSKPDGPTDLRQWLRVVSVSSSTVCLQAHTGKFLVKDGAFALSATADECEQATKFSFETHGSSMVSLEADDKFLTSEDVNTATRETVVGLSSDKLKEGSMFVVERSPRDIRHNDQIRLWFNDNSALGVNSQGNVIPCAVNTRGCNTALRVKMVPHDAVRFALNPVSRGQLVDIQNDNSLSGKGEFKFHPSNVFVMKHQGEDDVAVKLVQASTGMFVGLNEQNQFAVSKNNTELVTRVEQLPLMTSRNELLFAARIVKEENKGQKDSDVEEEMSMNDDEMDFEGYESVMV